MNRLKTYTIIGIIFVTILGTLSHFFYEWSNNNTIIGFVSPVNESTWEHMKLIFFPMLLFSMFAIPKLKKDYPCISSALWFGILSGTFAIPIIFYTYTGIIGYNIFILDILTFIFSVVAAFLISYKLTLSCKMQTYKVLLCMIVCVMAIGFVLFTIYSPNINLFYVPT